MKTRFSILVFFLMMTSRALPMTVLIQGQVINDSLNIPISGQTVKIVSTNLLFLYSNEVNTNQAGFFSDTILNVSDTSNIHFLLQTFDLCENQWVDTVVYSINSPIFVLFHLCKPQNVFSCLASFSHEIDSLNATTIQFLDQSIIIPPGPVISSWFWDFGDGTSSTLQNPVHSYPSSGIYQICLTITSQDSTGFNCTDDTCRNITIEATIHTCLASFSHEIDSLDATTVHFLDQSTINPPGPVISSWFWDFGDGTSSTMQNPVHSYNSFGTYRVCLTITSQDSSGISCTDDTCQNLTLEPQFNFGGLVFAGNYPINNPEPTGDTGVAYLYRIGNGEITAVDTMTFYQYGYYWFANIPEGDYLVKVHLTSSSNRYKEYSQTYFPAAGRWQDGEVIHLADSGFFDADIHLQEAVEESPGNGMIMGQTIWGDAFPLIDPYPWAEIKLFNDDQQLVAFTFSGEEGFFTFTNLPFGLYHLQVDVTGMYTIPATVYLDEMLVSADSLLLPVFERDITSINDGIYSSDIRVAPNPFTEAFNILLPSGTASSLTLRLYEPTGRLAYCNQIPPGRPEFQIVPSPVSPGFYLLLISDEFGHVVFTGKVIRM